MKHSIFLLITFTSPVFTFSQQVSYNDVAVVVNDNSQISIDIGNYFAQHRNIPSQNIIHITTTTLEEIDTAQLFDLLSQVSGYLTANNLVDSINYIVTTKGVPLKVSNGICNYIAGCASVESEMALMLSPYTAQIGGMGGVPNPYYYSISNTHFKHSLYGTYLVTRLDGYSYNDVIALIDRSGANTPVIKNNAQFVFDISHYIDPSDTLVFVTLFHVAGDTLANYGWNYVLDEDTAVLLNQSNVLGIDAVDYNSAGQVLNYSWLKGSVGELLSTYTAFTFDSSQNTDNRFLVADAIKEGATGVNGYVYGTYVSQALRYDILLSRYIDTSNHFNLAESYYMATLYLSTTYEIIGDPKTSIVLDTLNGIAPIANTEIEVYPNPSMGIFHVSFPVNQNCAASVCDLLGNVLWAGKWNSSDKTHSINLQLQPSGMYFLRVKHDGGEYIMKVVKQ